MQFAQDASGQRVTPHPDGRAQCPGCRGDVIAKCGEIVAWHWAHLSADCDHWSEPESAWHLGWKEAVIPLNREVVIGPHRADMITLEGADDLLAKPTRLVVELQHSAISPEEIREREQFYGRMCWIFDAEEFKDNFEIQPSKSRFQDQAQWRFNWKWARQTVLGCVRPVFIDLRDGTLFRIRKVQHWRWGMKFCRKCVNNVFVREAFGNLNCVVCGSFIQVAHESARIQLDRMSSGFGDLLAADDFRKALSRNHSTFENRLKPALICEL